MNRLWWYLAVYQKKKVILVDEYARLRKSDHGPLPFLDPSSRQMDLPTKAGRQMA